MVNLPVNIVEALPRASPWSLSLREPPPPHPRRTASVSRAPCRWGRGVGLLVVSHSVLKPPSLGLLQFASVPETL